MAETSDDLAEQARWGAALKKVRREIGMTQPVLAERLGWTVQNIGYYERGRRQGILLKAVRKRLTDAMGVSPETLEQARAVVAGDAKAVGAATGVAAKGRGFVSAMPSQQLLPIRDRAQAGAWLPSDDQIQDWPRRYPAAKDARFIHADQWLTEVVGDMVDQLRIYNGDFVHCVDLEGSGHPVKTGDVVEVVRLRDNGAERELSIRQAEVTGGGILLWPRSSNPKWQTPLQIRAGVGEDDDAEVYIRGLVLHVIRQLS